MFQKTWFEMTIVKSRRYAARWLTQGQSRSSQAACPTATQDPVLPCVAPTRWCC